MEVTLNLDDDVLVFAEEQAALKGMSVGEVISDLARRGMQEVPSKFRTRNGVALLPSLPGDRRVTSEMVYEMQEHIDFVDGFYKI